MSGGIGFFLMIIMLIAGGPARQGDLLDMIPSEIYWQAKGVTPSVEQLEKDAGPPDALVDPNKVIADLGAEDFKTREIAKKKLEAMGPAVAPLLKPALDSKDPEISGAATALLKQFAAQAQAREVRRLMAIRTLGEVKARAALPVLKTLTESKDLFVADYALRAVAQIEGKTVAVADHRRELAEDVQLLPKDTGIVGQLAALPGPSVTVEMMAEVIHDQWAQQGGMMPGGDAAPDQKKILDGAVREVLKFADSVGNMRIDGMTVGIAQDVGPQNGWVVMALRGKFDAAAFLAATKNDPAGKNAKTTQEGNVRMITNGRETWISPSNEQLILVLGPPSENDKTGPVVESVLNALKTGKGEFAQNEDLAKLIKTVDRTGPAWAAGKLNPETQKEKIFEGVDAFTLATKLEKDGTSFLLTGQGDDADKLKGSADAISAGIQGAAPEARALADKMKSYAAAADLLESIKVDAHGKEATMTGLVKPGIVRFILGESPLRWMIMRSERELLQPAETQP